MKYMYLFHAAKILQEKSSSVEKLNSLKLDQVLSPTNFPDSLLFELGKYHTKYNRLDLALRSYERNFLMRMFESAPFKNSQRHWKMIEIYLTQGKTELANTMFEYLYQLYWRESEGRVRRETFLRRIQKDYPGIEIKIK
ncbi:hypothetical protein [Candidatus Uabimicrobium sp. HlEnr_7]|uniref:hypothetical protein n=1 Tax=Candidatus Uabimicrobium helgolandensis TaxID=3095367 RepID=UPI003558E178